MPRIELSITADYLPTWGVWEGIRELLQNGKDAETELGARLVVTHRGTLLRIENEGATLPHKALLLGHTSKAGRDDVIGRFGEGLKLGVLALVRVGVKVVIRSANEVWTPMIERSERFDADVLVFHIQGGRVFKERVCVEVDGVDKDAWVALQKRFLFLTPPSATVSTPYGTLLLDAEAKGKIFVKGIYVQDDPTLSAGYDFIGDVTLDRDRKMVANWDLRFRTHCIWEHAVAQDGTLLERFVIMAETNASDLAHVSADNARWAPKATVEAVARDWKTRHGDDAVPCKDMNESRDVAYLGKRGVVVSAPMAALLTPVLGTVDAVKLAAKNEVVKLYSWADLPQVERDNYDWAFGLVERVANVATPLVVNVVDFRDSRLAGQWKGGEVFLAKVIAADRYETLATLLHEVAHNVGGDGDHNHVAALEQLWTKVVRYLTEVPR